ncbi:hypothetical protein A2Z53_01500 [Candidatus Giovannonibacteria bacterium RIFCSPHIGHO2_02_42_15]|uniref:Uncharacterized protein n=2 Tax=Candidatus Giovannoniibacteriota TaxID=1752738 RepID=A0A1F5VPB0_9BACT|nr:MAG: hypothetical protein UV11_C0008G0039 [Candidatus Giovannonibacteria bacterium GW2011_GWF2_42_19]OGF64861.1 MAG: hypothetical protein A2Z53_01500 [Candidatus Giovannonibacteria bacterium RIFCSPHIGHO2_02_42_15]HBW55984.1 hypothetical protein [Candidatus Azambacteria bacterium]
MSILEINPLRAFIKNLILENRDLTEHLTPTIPQLNDTMTSLDYIIHSPVDIHLYDAEGNHAGLISNPLPNSDLIAYEAELPNSYYLEYGETKYAGSDGIATTTVQLIGKELGTFTFDINETLGDEIIASTTFKDIPVTASSTLQMDIKTIFQSTSLQMDVDGDGAIDTEISSGEGVTPQELIAILKGVIKTLGLSDKNEEKLLKKVEKLEKILEKEYKKEYKKKIKTKKAFLQIIEEIKKFKKKGVLSSEEAKELIEIVEKIREGVVE